MTSETFEKGLKIRSDVLGSDFVESSIENMSEFSRPLQELVTEFCFGAVWTRDGLSKRDRSLINIALLAAAGNSHALNHHAQAAITNGATVEEIRETLVHVIPYAGFPSAFDAFAVVEKALVQAGEIKEE
ncbi:carboxymuconolactone decarboxylase family protein [Paracoccaceae bacterium]|nr:carboxymuconolactone decarboxylase family protein [Paracoccaceae bacterium]